MVDISVIREAGGTQKKLESLFKEGPNSAKLNTKLKPLYDRIRSRISDGVTYALKNHRLYYALDLAWNTPLRQSAQTLLWSLVNKKADDKEVAKAIADWGLTHLVQTDGETKTINIPVFFEIFIPLVRAYLTIRWAKITNDRKNYPFFKYEPQRQSKDDRIKAEVITDRVQLITQQYDYFSVLKQSVFQMLHYGYCLQFPVESWHSEKQMLKVDGKTKEQYVREGIRYYTPHPTRCYIDLAHRPSTINSDSGVRFLGHWTIRRWREVKDTPGYWNLEKLALGSVDWITTYPTFFNTVGSSCAIKLTTTSSLLVPGQLDREKEIGFYSTDLLDSGVMLTEHFEKLNPKKDNLFDYDYDIWMRFVVANDDTIMFAEPIPYYPAVYYGYDSNENQSLNSSLSLEILPAQDMVSNLLSQYILSTKQNLANLNMLDSDAFQIDDKNRESFIQKLRNRGEKWFRELNFEWFSSRQNRAGQTKIGEAVQSFRFTPLPTDGLVGALRQVLDLLERTLVMSAQEVASAASHEQTAEEVKIIGASTSSRLEFTATPVDQAIYAWKLQLYSGLMAYGEDEFYAQLSRKVSKEKLKELGFTEEEAWDNEANRAIVKVTKSAIAMEGFASTRDAEDRVNTGAIAAAMSQVLGNVLSNERIINAIGEDQAIELINYIDQFMGLPEDFKLRVINKGIPPQQQLVQLLEQVKNQIMTEIGNGIKPIADSVVGLEQNVQAVSAQTQANSQQIAAQADLTQRLAKIVAIAAAPGGPPPLPPPFAPNAPTPILPPDNSGPPLNPAMAAPAGVPVA